MSRQSMARAVDADAGKEADRMRRREALLHTIELARRRRQRRLLARPSLA